MKRRFLLIATAAVAAATAVYAPVSAASLTVSTPSECSPIPVEAPAGAEVESVTAVSRPAGTFQVPGVPPLGGFPVPDVPARCEVTVTLTHGGDHARVRVWLPDTGWNGRFQVAGGSAYAAGDNGAALSTGVKQGYAMATTDAGVGDALDTSWALKDGRIDQTLLTNFADRSQHELALVGKQVIAAVYGKAASYSYWNGCSTGGRQGFMEAQRYPNDFDGILANAPGINWNQFEIATLWPQVVMNERKTYPTSCEFGAFNAAALRACDGRDGLRDGLVSGACDYDPRRLIGKKIVCDGKEVTITAADAAVVGAIWDGPRTRSGKRLWYGLPVGASFDFLAASAPDESGAVHGVPFLVPAAWAATFVKKNPEYDTSKLTYSKFEELFRQARTAYDDVIGTRDADLSAFRDAGGKLLTWHGTRDQLIPTEGTVDYRRRVERATGGDVDDFFRLFLAPGTEHCGLSGGQADDLAALIAWVEHGRPPATLSATLTTASGERVHRNLCRYPLVSRSVGQTRGFRCVPAGRMTHPA
ncbi:tannase/feruloyl esterase family alpha/beta hydrolase [Nonomuraea africana]|uniref:tannase/feruloyl esterase family alpha/beta hydrolase n=1 Tax=Nonomuraea africana TaxID=46171 RepID=UPI0034068554